MELVTQTAAPRQPRGSPGAGVFHGPQNGLAAMTSM